jgi:hypothetical protein
MDLNGPTRPLTPSERNDLLRYASGIALDRNDGHEVAALALALELHVFSRATLGEQRAMLAAMSQAFANRGRWDLPYRGKIQEFLDLAEPMYEYLVSS